MQPAAEDNALNSGWEIAVSGSRALAGVTGDDTYEVNSRSMAAFEYSSGSWSRTEQFVPPLDNRNPKDNFGRGVDLDGDTAVIGACHLDSSTGSWTGKGNIYRHNGNYGLTAKLYPPVPPEDDLFFGDTLAIESNNFLASEAAQAFVFQ